MNIYSLLRMEVMLMKKIIKKAISILLVAVMVFGAAPLAGFVGLELPELNLFSTKAEAATYSGTCGKNLSWSLNTSTGVLNITGSGAMTDFSYSSPWYSYHSYIKAVNIPNGVTTIGNWAFFLCENLTNITIPNSVKAIGEEAFGSCYSLKTITIPNSVTSLGIGAFDTCYNLSSVTIPNSVITIGGNAFYDCNSLTSVTIPNSVTTIGTGAFYSCDGLTNITIPNSVTTIGGYAFASCTNLKNVTIGNGVTTIGECAFTRCNKLASITIGNSVTTIGAGAFDSCTSLTNVKLPDSVTTIAAGMFYSCTSLTSITMGKKVTAIGDSAFRYCSSLKSITIPNSVTEIGWSTFGDCTAFTDVYYNGTEAQWKKITVDEGNEPLLNATIHYEKIKLISSKPANGEKYFSLENDIVLTFNQDIKEIYLPSICIREHETDKVVFTASAECIDINNNTLYLNNLVESPVVDKNGKKIEGVKLKGNMKYYLDIASDAISFDDGYFEGTKSKDDLAFSTYISKDRSLKEYGFKQEYTYLDNKYDFETSDKQKTKYLNGAGEAMATFCVPGLKEGMVPQGLTYYPEKQWYLISAYDKSDLPAEEKNNSVIYALDRNGNFVAQFNIHTAYGKDCRIHAGGIAVGKHNLYLTYYDSQIAYIPLSELDVPEKTVKDVCIRSSVDLGEQMRNTSVAYLSYSENGVLWTGNFYCPTPEAKAVGNEEIRTVENGKEKIIPGWDTPDSHS